MSFLKPSINLPAISTGTSLMKMSGGLGGGGATQMSPMESMKEVFLEIRDNSKQTVELLKTAVMGTAQERKEERIGAGDTDDKEEKGPGILSKVGTTLGKLNPFGGGGMLDTLGKLLLAVGGIALLKVFGDKAVGPLADLIKTVKEGKVGERIKETYEYLKEKGFVIFEQIKEKTIELVEAFKKVKDFIVDTYNKISDFIMSFDENDDGILDEEERRNLRLVITKKIGDFIYNTFGKIFDSLGVTFKLLSAASILKYIGGRAGTAGAGLGLLGTAALAAVAAAGIYTLYENINFALKDSLDEDTGDLQGKEFAAKLLAGKDAEGGAMNAASNALDKSLIGMVTGGVIGFLIGGPAGAILGAKIGFASGGVIGAALGYLGSNLLTGTDPGDTEALSKELTEAKIELATEEILQSENPEYAKSDLAKDKLKTLKDSVTELTEDVDIAPSINKVQRSEKIEKKIKSLEKQIKKNQKLLDEGTTAVPIYGFQGNLLETMIPEQIIRESLEEIEKLTKKKEIVDKSITVDDIAVVGNERQKSEFADSYFGKFGYTDADYLFHPDIAKKLIELGADMKTSENKQGMVFANNKTNSDNTKVEQHQHGAGLMSSISSVTSAKILASKE